MPLPVAPERLRLSARYWGRNRRTSSLLPSPLAFSLALWKIRVRLDFFYLFCVPLTVRCDKENELITVHFAHRTIHHVIPQSRCRLEILLSRRAAFEKMFERSLRRTKPIVGHERTRRLRLVGSVGNHHQNRRIDLLHITIRLPRR